jgi:hypothetical protein
VVPVNGEVDVVVPVQDAEGRRLWAVLQSKARLHRGDVRAWGRMLRDATFRTRLAQRGVPGPLLPYAFGLRVHLDADEEGRANGIGILGLRGERVAPGGPLE